MVWCVGCDRLTLLPVAGLAYTWGRGDSGQLGRCSSCTTSISSPHHDHTNVLAPLCLPWCEQGDLESSESSSASVSRGQRKVVIHIAAGANHTLLATGMSCKHITHHTSSHTTPHTTHHTHHTPHSTNENTHHTFIDSHIE